MIAAPARGPMQAALLPGFADPVRDAQRAFRAVLDALANPGRILRVPTIAPPPGCNAAAAAMLLTLVDADTPVWTDAGDAAAEWLRFHAGCPLVPEPQHAAFVHVSRSPPPLALLEAGSAAQPQRGATLLLEVDSLQAGTGWRLTGPGIETAARIAVAGLPGRFAAEWAANHARYPAGVDVVFCAPDRIAGLPRSTHLDAA